MTHKTGGTIVAGIGQGVRFVTGIGFSVLWHHRGYDLLRAVGSACCDITHETGSTICYGHWALRLVISQTKQEEKIVIGISHTRREVRFVIGIGFCVL